jgi:hypothetical protein
MPKAPTELVVIEKTYALLIWSVNQIAKFPRVHRYSLGQRLEQRIAHVLDLLLRAKYTTDRLPALREANLELELLRFQFRAARDLKCLSVESSGSAARFVNEIGKLVGGWIKQAQGSENEAPRRTMGKPS